MANEGEGPEGDGSAPDDSKEPQTGDSNTESASQDEGGKIAGHDEQTAQRASWKDKAGRTMAAGVVVVTSFLGNQGGSSGDGNADSGRSDKNEIVIKEGGEDVVAQEERESHEYPANAPGDDQEIRPNDSDLPLGDPGDEPDDPEEKGR